MGSQLSDTTERLRSLPSLSFFTISHICPYSQFPLSVPVERLLACLHSSPLSSFSAFISALSPHYSHFNHHPSSPLPPSLWPFLPSGFHFHPGSENLAPPLTAKMKHMTSQQPLSCIQRLVPRQSYKLTQNKHWNLWLFSVNAETKTFFPVRY